MECEWVCIPRGPTRNSIYMQDSSGLFIPPSATSTVSPKYATEAALNELGLTKSTAPLC